MSDPRDLSGVWYGRYAADDGQEDNAFIAHLAERGGRFDGTISEPDPMGGGVRRAQVSGRRRGASLDFVKQYDGSGGLTHAVHYWGTIDGEGTAVAGRWIVQGFTGGFDMHREKFDAALEAEEQGVPLLPEPATPPQ